MSAKSIKIPKKLTRFLSIDATRMDEESRTVELPFSSEFPVLRYFGNEIMDHSGMNLDRMNAGGAVLWNHNWDDQIGVVEKAWIDEERASCKIRFSKSARGEEMWQDVKDGIRRNVSFGYSVEEMKLEAEREDGPDDYRVTKCEVLEISLVSVPADPTVGIGRGADQDEVEVPVVTREQPKDPNTQGPKDPNDEGTTRGGQADEAPDENDFEEHERGGETIEDNSEKTRVTMPEDNEHMTAERNRVSGIHKLASNPAYAKFCGASRVQKWIDEGASEADVTNSLLRDMGAEEIKPGKPELELPEREAREFSIVRAINQIASGGKLEGVEKEISDATAKHVKRDAQGFFIPNAVAKRALNAGTGSAGGYTVDTDLQSGSMVDLLRNKTKVGSLGARMLTGLVGDVAIPKHTGGATAYWLGETETATDSQQTFGQILLTPHRLVGTTPFSKQLLAQSSLDVEGFVRGDIASVLAIAKDLACINGSGADGEPRGIMNTTGINAGVTFGGAATWADVVQFETDIYTDNAEVENMAFLTTPATQGKWKTIERAANTGLFLLDDDRTANGYRFEVTNQVPSNKVIFGNWADLIIADWDGIDVVVDPYTLAKSGQIQITVTLMTDVAVRHPVSFSVSTDSGAQ